MDTRTQTNQLKGFVESLKLSDNISKAQLDTLYSKLDKLIKSLEDELWDEALLTTTETKINVSKNAFTEEEHDDLPF
jgi:hypothetical protein